MAASAIFCRVLLLVLNAAAHPHRRLLPPLRRGRLLRDNAAILMVLGASDLFHAVADGPTDASHAITAAGFLIWVAGVALLLVALTPGRFPPGRGGPRPRASRAMALAAAQSF
jgi:hypothetical protein